MRIAKRLVFAAVALALGWWLWTVFFPGPEKVIRRRLTQVARTASFAANEGALARLANVQELAGCFSADIEIVADFPGYGPHTFSGRDELTRNAMFVRGTFSALRVEFLDADVELAPDRQSAVVDLTTRANVPGNKDFMIQEMKFTFKKVNRDWLIARVETVKSRF